MTTQYSVGDRLAGWPMVTDRFIDRSLLTQVAGAPRLRASRCLDCGNLSFPYAGQCPRCSVSGAQEVALPETGQLWAWTIQSFRPKHPFPAGGEFEPFGVGYVEFPGLLKVESLLTTADPRRLRIGMAVRLAIVAAPGGGVPGGGEPADLIFAYGPVP